ncbi:tctex1 domain-containing protein 1-A [Orussus abietinus]|uniref:tctex1 domain-containing protein 1-A n=1 Tax=Orussus abietinus TaxID=222816 RepID=UPI00062558AC|nr:tctex1 domain-containing protein 1-A [Orussus abietinus]
MSFSPDKQSSAHRKPIEKTPQKLGTGSVSSLELHRGSTYYRNVKDGFKVPLYQNTYRLEGHHRFNGEVVDGILKETMDTALINTRYHPAKCLKYCREISSEVRERVYKKNYDRYKFVVTISIIEKTGQSLNIGLGRLWDTQRDTYSSYVFENNFIYAVGVVVGIYYE